MPHSFFSRLIRLEEMPLKITEQVRSFAEPIVEAHGCKLWDVEYVREGAQWYLRLYIDKDGGVDIADCETISRAVDPVLDEKDPIAESYCFEVCSAGIERALKRPSDFEQFLGSDVLVKLYGAKDGAKEYVGRLARYEDGNVTVVVGEQEKTFSPQEVALVRLYVEY